MHSGYCGDMWVLAWSLCVAGLPGLSCAASPAEAPPSASEDASAPDGSAPDGGSKTDAAGNQNAQVIGITDAALDAGTCHKSDGGKCYIVVDAGPYCGDGIVEPELGEECDDGNRRSGDGCSANCKLEPNFVCPTPGQPCVSTIPRSVRT